jgi:single-stranded DNA-binding protein
MYEQMTVIGYAGKVTKGETYLKVTIGASTSYKDKTGKEKEQTNWYTVTIWDEKRREHYGDKIKKGDLVLAVGTPSVSLYEKGGKKGFDFAISTEYGGKFRVIRYASTANDTTAGA